MDEIRALIVRMATDNRDWGYTRIQGALANLDHQVSRGTIATILRDHGLDPAPERLKRTTWSEFLKIHWDVLAAADFFAVDVWTVSGLTRVAVLFIIELSTCRIQIAGITSAPDSAWMGQMSRNLTDASDGFLTGKRFLIHDWGSAVHAGVPRDARRRRRTGGPPASPFPESQCIRGAVRADHQGILSGPDNSRR